MAERSRRRGTTPRYDRDQIKAAMPVPSQAEAVLVPLSTRVPPEVKRRLKMQAAARDISIQEVVAQAVIEWLDSRP